MVESMVYLWLYFYHAYFFNAESLRSVAAHELGKATDRNSTSAGDELQQSRPSLVIALFDQLPEPLDLKTGKIKVRQGSELDKCR